MRRGLALALLLLASSASAQGDAPLASVADLDPMELARVGRRVGDAGILEALEAAAPDPSAILATPWMRAPEAALPRLVALAGGRDPWRAPLAMQAILRIADSDVRDGMATREAAPLDEALAGLSRLADDEAARPDLRAAAALARAQLVAP